MSGVIAILVIVGFFAYQANKVASNANATQANRAPGFLGPPLTKPPAPTAKPAPWGRIPSTHGPVFTLRNPDARTFGAPSGASAAPGQTTVSTGSSGISGTGSAGVSGGSGSATRTGSRSSISV